MDALKMSELLENNKKARTLHIVKSTAHTRAETSFTSKDLTRCHVGFASSHFNSVVWENGVEDEFCLGLI